MRSLAQHWLFARLCCSCLQLKGARESSGVRSVKRRMQLRSCLLLRATQGTKRCRSESVESWHASTRAIAHALLKELFETCAFAVQSCKTCRLWGTPPGWQSRASCVCAPDAQQQKFNCKGKIAARGPFSVYTSVRNKATRLDWRRELAAGLQGCCTLCWSARERPAAHAAQREACVLLASLAASHFSQIRRNLDGRVVARLRTRHARRQQ